MRVEVPVEKAWLADQERVEGFTDLELKRGFGSRLAEMRGRPAFSHAFVDLQRDLEVALEELAEDPNIFGSLDEIAVRIDNHLQPRHVQFVFILSATGSRQAVQWIETWYESAYEKADSRGIVLHAFEIKLVSEVSLADYRSLTNIWRRL